MNKKNILLLIVLLFAKLVSAQQFPVQANIQLIPPYTVYLSDFTSADFGEKLRLTLLLKDIQQQELDVKLKFTIEGLSNNVIIQTSPDNIASSILLTSGVPEIIGGSELTEYFNPNNLIFSGLDANDFLTTSKLPEGLYRFTIQVVETNRNIVVSNTSFATAWLMLNDPPQWIMPQNNITLTPITPQNIIFTWLPRHTGSPNSAFSTEYEFTIVDVPQGMTPQEAIEQNNPSFFFQTTTNSSTLLYDQSFPQLYLGNTYACRIRAYDVNGLDVFKNNGYSAIISFKYGDECLTPFAPEVMEVTEYNALLSWQGRPGNNSWLVHYRPYLSDTTFGSWHQIVADDINFTLDSLNPTTLYQFKVQGECAGGYSDFTSVVEFETNEAPPHTCLDDADIPEITNYEVNEDLGFHDVVYMGTFRIKFQIVFYNSSTQTYSGWGVVRNTPFMVELKGKFSNLKVNTDNQVIDGEINIIEKDRLTLY